MKHKICVLTKVFNQLKISHFDSWTLAFLEQFFGFALIFISWFSSKEVHHGSNTFCSGPRELTFSPTGTVGATKINDIVESCKVR